jgi:hypothetical protein
MTGTLDWKPLKDDGCRWILDVEGGPFPVYPCICGAPVEIFGDVTSAHHKVTCPSCGRHTPEVIGGSLLETLKLWNDMVDEHAT